jgi:Rad3-related DNA helicase
MIDDLAITMSKLASKIPGGMLIFFPSYRLMNDTYERWN